MRTEHAEQPRCQPVAEQRHRGCQQRGGGRRLRRTDLQPEPEPGDADRRGREQPRHVAADAVQWQCVARPAQPPRDAEGERQRDRRRRADRPEPRHQGQQPERQHRQRVTERAQVLRLRLRGDHRRRQQLVERHQHRAEDQPAQHRRRSSHLGLVEQVDHRLRERRHRQRQRQANAEREPQRQRQQLAKARRLVLEQAGEGRQHHHRGQGRDHLRRVVQARRGGVDADFVERAQLRQHDQIEPRAECHRQRNAEEHRHLAQVAPQQRQAAQRSARQRQPAVQRVDRRRAHTHREEDDEDATEPVTELDREQAEHGAQQRFDELHAGNVDHAFLADQRAFGHHHPGGRQHRQRDPGERYVQRCGVVGAAEREHAEPHQAGDRQRERERVRHLGREPFGLGGAAPDQRHRQAEQRQRLQQQRDVHQQRKAAQRVGREAVRQLPEQPVVQRRHAEPRPHRRAECTKYAGQLHAAAARSGACSGGACAWRCACKVTACSTPAASQSRNTRMSA